LRNLIRSFAEIKVVAEAADGREAVALADLHRPWSSPCTRARTTCSRRSAPGRAAT
jgi:hypothetical protein